MFFIMGISNKEVKLNFDQLIICDCCGKYGHIYVYKTYTYLMFFFIPIFKWNKHYYAKMNCCSSVCELDYDIGREIELGNKNSLDESEVNFKNNNMHFKICKNCGYATEENFIYCPRCGEKFI